TVKDILIVSIGDSYASGEGNPEVRGVLNPQWAVGANARITQEHADAHRSSRSAPALTALDIERANPHTSVTFLHLAHTGAEVPDVRGPTGQIQRGGTLVGTRPIDGLFLSIGGNDIGFTNVALRLLGRTPPVVLLPVFQFDNIQADVNRALSTLPTLYQTVNT